MTDAPEGPSEGEPERGSRRTPRVDGGGSPVGSTLSIVLAVIAVIAGFLILRAITDDDDDAGGLTPTTNATTPGSGSTDDGSVPGSGTAPVVTEAPVARNAATVVVANASGIGGSAGAMSTALAGAGYVSDPAQHADPPTGRCSASPLRGTKEPKPRRTLGTLTFRRDDAHAGGHMPIVIGAKHTRRLQDCQ